jgi:tRNA pseudouridine32 synthase/23S rRNA pseudouridine746 synthase
MFSEGLIDKTYIAVAKGKPKKKQGLIVGDMEKSRRGQWKLIPSTVNPARTRFYSILLDPKYRLYILKPITGKTHQLRVAMKSLSVPILGDRLYAAEDSDRVYLHAFCLKFSFKSKDFIFKLMPTTGEYFTRIRAEEFDKFL